MFRKALILAMWLLLISVGNAALNQVILTEKAGLSTNNYPIQIGRPFIQGEFPSGIYPKAIINGVPVETQVDVKTRWPLDNSISHAVLSFYIPTFTANTSITITFDRQSTSNTDPLDIAIPSILSETQPHMLSDYEFDPRIVLSNGENGTAFGKTMLQNGHFIYWLRGSVQTTIILADHSNSPSYDMGTHTSFRPIFHVTFWPLIHKLRIRFIGEIANTEALTDMHYDLKLMTGPLNTQTVYTQTSILHHARSRWTKEFWVGGTPSKLEINHHLPYLVLTKFFPNYDTTKAVSSNAIDYAYNTNGGHNFSWKDAPKKLFDSGNWDKGMPIAGGRPEIGPYPTWTVRWLYTGDWRVQEQAFGNADLAAAWPVHFREGNISKTMDGVQGLGRPLAITNRPTFRQWKMRPEWTDTSDRLIIFNPITHGDSRIDDTLPLDESIPDTGWQCDGAHQPDPFSPQYTLTGDYWYLEEMLFWASWSAARHTYGNNWEYTRGPTGTEGGLSEETRGEAWVFRSRAQTAFLTPDGFPEKNYFKRLTLDAIAIWEGAVNIRGTSFEGSPLWVWGNTIGINRFGTLGVPTLHYWKKGFENYGTSFVDYTKAETSDAIWMQNFLIYALGRSQELGFPTEPLLKWMSVWLNGQLSGGDYNYLTGAYVVPVTRKPDKQFFSTWTEARAAYLSTFKNDTGNNNWCGGPETCTYEEFFKGATGGIESSDHGYALIALAAVSMTANQPGGAQAWAFMKEKALDVSIALNDNPKWALLPREIAAASAPGRPKNLRKTS